MKTSEEVVLRHFVARGSGSGSGCSLLEADAIRAVDILHAHAEQLPASTTVALHSLELVLRLSQTDDHCPPAECRT